MDAVIFLPTVIVILFIAASYLLLKPEQKEKTQEDTKLTPDLAVKILTPEDAQSLRRCIEGIDEESDYKTEYEFNRESSIWSTTLHKSLDDYYDLVRLSRIPFLKALTKEDKKVLFDLVGAKGQSYTHLEKDKEKWLNYLKLGQDTN